MGPDGQGDSPSVRAPPTPTLTTAMRWCPGLVEALAGTSRLRHNQPPSWCAQIVPNVRAPRCTTHKHARFGRCPTSVGSTEKANRVCHLRRRPERFRNAEVGSSILLPSTNFS